MLIDNTTALSKEGKSYLSRHYFFFKSTFVEDPDCPFTSKTSQVNVITLDANCTVTQQH